MINTEKKTEDSTERELHHIEKNTEIAKTWLTGQRSVTLILERKIAEEYGLIDPQYVVLERRKEGILIRKLEV